MWFYSSLKYYWNFFFRKLTITRFLSFVCVSSTTMIKVSYVCTSRWRHNRPHQRMLEVWLQYKYTEILGLAWPISRAWHHGRYEHSLTTSIEFPQLKSAQQLVWWHAMSLNMCMRSVGYYVKDIGYWYSDVAFEFEHGDFSKMLSVRSTRSFLCVSPL